MSVVWTTVIASLPRKIYFGSNQNKVTSEIMKKNCEKMSSNSIP